MKIGAIVLAAGSSSRLGQPKQLLNYFGQTLVRRAVEAALGARCSPIVVVVGREQKEIALALRDLEVSLVPNDSWQRGIGTSIRAGVEALPSCNALVILACDQPHVDAQLICQLIETHERTRQPMVACAYAGTLGVPALFARAYFEKLLSLGEEQGAKSLLILQPDDVAPVHFPGGAIDIDTPEDWRKLPNEL